VESEIAVRKTVEEQLSFSKIDQIGVIVEDMDKAVKYYEDLGIGPFQDSKLIIIDRRVRGRFADDVKNKVKLTHMGHVQLELVQPVSGESVQKEFLTKYGEGINHLAFFIDNLDKEVAKCTKRGSQVMSSGRFVGGGGFAYLDTDRVGGVIFELIQLPPR